MTTMITNVAKPLAVTKIICALEKKAMATPQIAKAIEQTNKTKTKFA